MYLKNIEVQGFKSFAQRINFEFHNGITGIVGPNGSGKSNVGDAVRWVLGEQSAKQLRGGNMQDVIFSGTELRKPLSYASVAITLDNSDHHLPIDYNEVTVTRRLYRSGESEYLINGSACRLKDINEMFYDTGIGKEGYSIIGQGQIEKILNGKPEDRRELFDEAAGIVKFKRRKNTTIKKLEQEHQNLLRVTDILSELTKQLEPLERQSETAKIYLLKKERLKELDINMFLMELESSNRSLKENKEKYELALNEFEHAQKAYEQTKAEYEKLDSLLEELSLNIDNLRDNTQNKAIYKQQLEGKVNVLKEQIISSEQNKEHYNSRMMVIEDEKGKKEQEKNLFEEEKNTLHTTLIKIRKEISEEDNNLKNLQTQIDFCINSIEEGKNEIIELLNLRANIKAKAQRFDTLIEQIDIRKAQINQKILSLKSEEEIHMSLVLKAKESYNEATQSVNEIQKRAKEIDQEISTIQEELQGMNAALVEEQKYFHKEASRLESLKNITERYDGYGNSIRRVMEQRSSYKGIQGVVADLFHVEKKFEIAIETALGGSIQNIVTDDEQTAKDMIEFLKRNKYGRATFLPLNSINGNVDFGKREALQEKGAIGIASDLVSTEECYRKLTRFLLGRILVVDTIDHAILIARKYKHSFRMVTLEGESLNPGGSMSGGAFKNNSNLLGRRREIEELEASVKKQQIKIDNLTASIKIKRETREHLNAQQTLVQEELRKQYIFQNTEKMKLSQLQEKAADINHGYDSIKTEQEEIRNQIIDVKKEYSVIEKELNISQKDEKELEEFIDSRQQELDALKKEEALCLKNLEEMKLEENGFSQKEGFISQNISRLLEELHVLEEEKENLLESMRVAAEEVLSKKEIVHNIKNEIQEFLQEEKDSKEKLEEWQKEKENLVATQKASYKKRDELSEKTSLLDKECFRLKTSMDKLDEEREGLIAYMWEEYEITPNNALIYKKEELSNSEEIKKEIDIVKNDIKKLGSVNVNAIEEYKNLLERHSFLSGQYEDLLKAEETLKGIIQELDEGMRKQFSEKFKDIQKEFDKAFKELFGGGKGSLELDEDEDLLEAGIHIISQPPGKKLQNMMQLSGGEKALTAIALLFAIQNLKPSPFCLLDEIEAALDDSNVGRFAGYLKKLTKNTQFIIITHRRGTMSAADRLYGITMQEKGVSTLVSVDLVEHQLMQ